MNRRELFGAVGSLLFAGIVWPRLARPSTLFFVGTFHDGQLVPVFDDKAQTLVDDLGRKGTLAYAYDSRYSELTLAPDGTILAVRDVRKSGPAFVTRSGRPKLRYPELLPDD